MPNPLEDPYVYPGTRVLRNTRGIRDADQLARVEADVTALALAELAERGLLGGYDLTHLQAIHRAIFGDLYPWAGQVRTVTISKPGSLFALPQHIESAAADIFGRLARANHLRGLDRDSFIEQVAELWGDVDALHPFREGNGRATRAFLLQLAVDADHHLAWARLDPDANIDAARAAVNGDNAPRRGLLEDLVDVNDSGRPRSPAQLRALIDAIRARHARPLPRPREQPP